MTFGLGNRCSILLSYGTGGCAFSMFARGLPDKRRALVMAAALLGASSAMACPDEHPIEARVAGVDGESGELPTGVGEAAEGLKTELRTQITNAGLGPRLARTWRSETFPKGQNSIRAAGLVWSKAPGIIRVYENGAIIRSKNGFFLAIPTAAAGRYGDGGRKITPGGWERRTGQRLRFVYRKRGPSLLVADTARLNTRGLAAANRRKIRRSRACGANAPGWRPIIVSGWARSSPTIPT